ncbi:MAG: phosphoribosyl-ATP diphosphatase [Alphaproteobacteria bacterium]|nr:phosphoribosyl-ATP diphosphatase [Alphaproteobacteria bacterium]
MTATSATLEEIFAVIKSRQGADPESSYTARLFHRGIPKIAQKLGEEAVETLIEGVKGDKELLVMESADLLYHLLVLWAAVGVEPAQIWEELSRRAAEKGQKPKPKK